MITLRCDECGKILPHSEEFWQIRQVKNYEGMVIETMPSEKFIYCNDCKIKIDKKEDV